MSNLFESGNLLISLEAETNSERKLNLCFQSYRNINIALSVFEFRSFIESLKETPKSFQIQREDNQFYNICFYCNNHIKVVKTLLEKGYEESVKIEFDMTDSDKQKLLQVQC